MKAVLLIFVPELDRGNLPEPSGAKVFSKWLM